MRSIAGGNTAGKKESVKDGCGVWFEQCGQGSTACSVGIGVRVWSWRAGPAAVSGNNIVQAEEIRPHWISCFLFSCTVSSSSPISF